MPFQLNDCTKIPGITELRFVLVGIANTLLGLSIIYFCKWFLGVEDIAANIAGYVCGLMFSFVANRAWTFHYQGDMINSLFRFMLVVLMAYLCNLITVLASIKLFAINSYVSQALGVIPYATITYVGSKYYAFDSSKS